MSNTFKTDGRIQQDNTSRFFFEDHFFKVNDEDWLITGDAGATVAQSAASGFQLGGWARFTSGATNNDEAYFTTGSWYKCQVNKRFGLKCRFALTEAATNAANFCIGFINAGAANVLIDDGGGPIVAADKALLYKLDAAVSPMLFNAVTAKTTGTSTNVKTSTGVASFVSATIYEVEVIYEPAKGSLATDIGIFHYWINGVEVATHPVTAGTASTGTTAMPTAQMTPIIGIKAGTAAAQTLDVDYLAVYADL